MLDLTGKTISHYKVLEKIGEGGMGVVYKARDTKLKRFIALKFLHPHQIADQEKRARFFLEAQAAAALNHPNICTIYEIDETATDDRQIFIAMEYVAGQNLQQNLETGLFKFEQTLDIAIQIAEGLCEAHSKGVIHRDIKSANIMVTVKGQVKIMDFGLAKLTTGVKISQDGKTLGTLAYISPEQARGEQVDHRTDIWSLGVILYEMITGQLPFEGENEIAIVISVLNNEPKPICECRSDIPAELEKIVNKSLAKCVVERYQKISDTLRDLEAFRKELEIPEEIHARQIKSKKSSEVNFNRILLPIGIIIFLISIFWLFKSYFIDTNSRSQFLPIVVLSFENKTGEDSYNYLQEVIPNLLITSLEQSKFFQVTTWERMYDLLKQIGKEESKFIDKDLGFELCQLDGVNVIVLGFFTKAGDMFVTNLKVLDVKTKKLLLSASTKGSGAKSILESQIDDLSEQISRGFGVNERELETRQRPIADVTTSSMDAYYYFLRGRDSFEKYYYTDAYNFLQQAVQLDSTFATAHLYFAWVSIYLGYPEERTRAYEMAKIYSERASEKERLYIELYYARYIEHDMEKALSLYQKLAKKYPKEKRFHYEFAHYYWSKKKSYPEAIMHFNRALELDPHYGMAINSLGFLYTELENYEIAIQYFQRYALLFPGDAHPFDSIAMLYFRMGKLDESIKKLKEALVIKPDFFMTLRRIGYIYALMEKYTEAINSCDHIFIATSVPSERQYGYFLKGFYYLYLGRFDESLRELNKASLLFNKQKAILSFIEQLKSKIYFDCNNFELCRESLKKMLDLMIISKKIEKWPERDILNWNAIYNFNLGLIDLKEGRVDSTRSQLAKIELAIKNPKLEQYFQHTTRFQYDILHGELLYAQDSLEQVIIVCEQSSDIELANAMWPGEISYVNLTSFNDLLARAYKAKGESEKAIAEYERLTTFDPMSKARRLIHPIFHYRLAKLYEEVGKFDKAIEEYKKFLSIWKDADEHLPEKIDAKQKLSQLRR